MAYEIPADIIQQVQILLRKEGSFDSYNPDDPSLPSPPTLEAVIAEFDSSPGSIRCEHCKGKLLRGEESIICVYCGQAQHKESTPQPISFKSTVGFRWLLDSLGLHESETVGQPVEDTLTRRGQKSPRNDVALGDYLDLKLLRPDESERFGVNGTNLEESGEKKSLYLAGTDFKKFSGEKTETFSGIGIAKQLGSNETDEESQDFPVRENWNLSQSQQSSLGDNMKSGETAISDSFTGWEADFQSATSVAQNSSLMSSEPLKKPAVEYAVHMDTVFGHVRDDEGSKAADASVSHASGDGWMSNDFETASRHGSAIPVDHSAVSFQLQDERQTSQADNPLSLNEDLFQEIQPHASNSESFDQAIVPNDSFDACDSIRAFSGAKDNQSQGSSSMIPESKSPCENVELPDAWGDFASSKDLHDSIDQTNSVAELEDNSSNTCSKFAKSSSVKDSESQNRTKNSFEEDSIMHNGNVFDMWDDFTGFSSAPQSTQGILNEKTFESHTAVQGETFDFWSGYASSAVQTNEGQTNGTPSVDDDTSMGEDESSDIWNDFTSSSVEQISQAYQQKSSDRTEEGEKVGSAVNNGTNIWNNFMRSTSGGNDKQHISGIDVFDRQSADEKDSIDARGDFTTPIGVNLGALNDISSSGDQQKSSFKEATGYKTTPKGDDSLDLWTDFLSPGGRLENTLSSNSTSVDKANVEDDIFGARNNTSVIISPQVRQQQVSNQSAPGGASIAEDGALSDSWGTFRNSTDLLDNQQQTSVVSQNNISTGDDFYSEWNCGGVQSTGEPGKQLSGDDKSAPENEDSVDEWTDFSSATALQGKNSQTSVPDNRLAVKHGDSFDVRNAVSALSKSENDDSIDDWTGFSRATALQGNKFQTIQFRVPSDRFTAEQNDSFNVWNSVAASAKSENDDSADAWTDFSSASALHGRDLQINLSRVPDDRLAVKRSDPFNIWNAVAASSKYEIDASSDAWTDFSSASALQGKNLQINLSSVPDIGLAAKQNDPFDVWNTVAASSKAENDDSSDAWTDFSSAIAVQGKKFQTRQSSVPDNTLAAKHDDSFDVRNAVSASSKSENDDSSDAWNDFSSASALQGKNLQISLSNAPDDRLAVEHNDSFDAWNAVAASSKSENDDSADSWTDFSSASALQGKNSQMCLSSVPDDRLAANRNDPFDVLNAASSKYQTSAAMFTNRKEKAGAKSFAYGSNLKDEGGPRLLLADPSAHGGSPLQLDALSPEDHVVARPRNGRVEDEDNADQLAKNEIIGEVACKTEPIDAETLISQMHDLSFTLDDHFSVPKG